MDKLSSVAICCIDVGRIGEEFIEQDSIEVDSAKLIGACKANFLHISNVARST